MSASTGRSRAGAALLGAAVVVLLLLAGCSKTRDGAVGIGPGEDGVVVQVVTCTHPATDVQLLVDDGSEQVAEAPVAQEAGTSRSYELAELFGTDVVEGLDPGVDYRLRGHVADEEGTRFTHAATFRLGEVAAYPSGEVSGNEIDGSMTQEAFAMQACDEDGPTGKS